MASTKPPASQGTDERSPLSALRGRLADVYVPALVAGAVEALSRRLGNRATIDDPLHGRAASLASIDPLLSRASRAFAAAGATYEPIGGTTGVDRDAAEGRLTLTVDGRARALPIAVVAERRRLREIEIRVYHASFTAGPPRGPRAALASSDVEARLADPIASIVAGLSAGAHGQVLAGFEEGGRIVDPDGVGHAKHDGAMRAFLDGLGTLGLGVAGNADDGRTACVEVTMAQRGKPPAPTLLAFERGESGLVRELRIYGD